MIIKHYDDLRATVHRIFLAAGAGEANASCMADHLTKASLSGVDTHGVLHVMNYVQSITDGEILPDATPEVIDDHENRALVHGRWTFGHVTCAFAMRTAIEKAKATGLSIVATVATNHIGRVGHYVEMAAAEGMIALVMGSGYALDRPHSAPYGGSRPALHTNPFSFAAPCEPNPMMFDYATTQVAGNKVKLAHRRGEPAPEGSIIDKHGRPTSDTNDFFNGGSYLPFGGHKGYALMMMVEYLGGMLAGSSTYLEEGRGSDLMKNQGVTIIVFKADLFRPMDDYLTAADETARRIRQVPPAPGFDKVLMPGDPEVEARRQRSKDGIPLDDDVWQSIVDAGKLVGVEV